MRFAVASIGQCGRLPDGSAGRTVQPLLTVISTRSAIRRTVRTVRTVLSIFDGEKEKRRRCRQPSALSGLSASTQSRFELDGHEYDDGVGAGRCQCALSSPPPILESKIAPHSPDEEAVGGVRGDGQHRANSNRLCADEAAMRGRSLAA